MKKIFIYIILVVSLLLLACSQKEVQLENGYYESGTIEKGNFAFIQLKENNEFVFMRAIAIDYLPTGHYRVEKNKLTLVDEGGLSYSFTISKDKKKLTYEKVNIENDFLEGFEFVYVGDENSLDINLDNK